MDDQLPSDSELTITEPVRPNPMVPRARWAPIGLLGIGAAALIAIAALAFGSTASPTGTLAAGSGSGSTGSAATGGVGDLHGGPGSRGGRGGHGFGEISVTAISGSDISLATEDGWTRTITVDDGTTYTKAGADTSLGDLAVGDTIAFRQTREDDGTWTIDAIAVLLPHVGGRVTTVAGSTITLELRGGTTATVNVGSDAKIVVNGDAAALGDIEVGMLLMAEGTENADGSLDATRVRAVAAGVRGERFGGRGPKGPGFFGDDDSRPDATAAPEATDSAS